MAKRRGFLKRMVNKLCTTFGIASRSPGRRVRFSEDAAVYEFERQLLGGGGVPDGDAVALGLGPRCVNSFLSPLSEKQDKDEYASSGYLDPTARTKLLAEWATKQSVKAQIERARCELEKLHKAREETANSPRDQRFMPSTMSEAKLFASQDEEEAQAARFQSAVSNSRLRKTPRRRCTVVAASGVVGAGSNSAGGSSNAKREVLQSPIRKSRRS